MGDRALADVRSACRSISEIGYLPQSGILIFGLKVK
jgi:hypothetical protein